MQSNAKLIEVALSGDHSAFADLVQRYERLVWTICWNILRDYHATQDVTQETFLVAHRRLSELRQPDSFGPWISSIARREALRCRKRNAKSTIRSDQSIESIATDADNSVSPNHDGLLAAVSSLPEHERTVTVLRFLNGHAVAEIAESTGRPIGTVTKQLSRALKRLKSKLDNTNRPLNVRDGESEAQIK